MHQSTAFNQSLRSNSFDVVLETKAVFLNISKACNKACLDNLICSTSRMLCIYFLIDWKQRHEASCIWKFVQRHFITLKLNAGCGGYLDKIYKILVDILDLKACFSLANFFIQSDFFRSKTTKSRIGSYFFYFDKCR